MSWRAPARHHPAPAATTEEAAVQSITPCLWFDDRIEEAVGFYTSTLPGGQVQAVHHGPDGGVLTIEFELAGQRLIALNGGPQFRFTEAISMFARCEDQAEVDHFWSALTADGGEEGQCGWLKDKYGLSWQIVPVGALDLLTSCDGEQMARFMEAMYPMHKLDLAALQAAVAATGT